MTQVILSAIVVIAVIALALSDKVVTSSEVSAIKAAIMQAVIAAQNEYGEGTGKLKLEVVKAAIIEKFPKVVKVIGEDKLEELIDAAKQKINALAADNDLIAATLNIVLDEDN